MPRYGVTDPRTGKKLFLTRDTPPSQEEALSVFDQFYERQGTITDVKLGDSGAESDISKSFTDAMRKSRKSSENVAALLGVTTETIDSVRDVERGREIAAHVKTQFLGRKFGIPASTSFQKPDIILPKSKVTSTGRGATGEYEVEGLDIQTAKDILRQQGIDAERVDVSGGQAAALGFATFPFAKSAAVRIKALQSDKPYGEALVEERDKINTMFAEAEEQHPILFKGGEVASDIAEFALISKLVTVAGTLTGSIPALTEVGKLTTLGARSKLFTEGAIFGTANKAAETLDEGDFDALASISNGIKDGLAFVALPMAGKKVGEKAGPKIKAFTSKLRRWAEGKAQKFTAQEAEQLSSAIDVAAGIVEKDAADKGYQIGEIGYEEALNLIKNNRKFMADALAKREGVVVTPGFARAIRRKTIQTEPKSADIAHNQARLNAPGESISKNADDVVDHVAEQAQKEASGFGKPTVSNVAYDYTAKEKFSFAQKLDAGRKRLNQLQREAGLEKDYAVNIRLNAYSEEAQYSLVHEAIRFHRELLKQKDPKIIFSKIREGAKKGNLKYLNMLLDLDKQKVVQTMEELRLTMSANSVQRTTLIKAGKQNTPEFAKLTESQNYLMGVLTKMGDFSGTLLRSFRQADLVGRTGLRGKTYAQWRKEIIASAEKLGKDIKQVTADMGKIDPEDPIAMSKFFDQNVAPKLGDLIDEYRYINMLSSPKTHIINTVTNMVQMTTTAPVLKAVAPIFDPAVSFLTGQQRQHYFGEVPKYFVGLFKNGSTAFGRALNAFRGKETMRLDLAGVDISSSGVKFMDLYRNFGLIPAAVGKLKNSFAWNVAKVPIRALEASDIYFRTLVAGGELNALKYSQRFAPKAGKLTEKEMLQKATESGMYYIFRQGLHVQHQGHLLNAVDDITKFILATRRAPLIGRPLGWVVPFIQTPVNIFKQGIEFSPLGFATTLGARNVSEQMAKAALGSIVFMGAGVLGMQNLLVWKAPENKKESDLFFASGMKPYSVILGGECVQFKYLGPWAYPLMLASAVQHHYNEISAQYKDPATRRTEEGKLIKIYLKMTPQVLGSMLGFLGELPYAQGFKNIIDFAGSVKESEAFAKVFSGFVRQVTPATGAVSWYNRLTDDYIRNPETFADYLRQTAPWPRAFEEIPTFENVVGGERMPAENKAAAFNAFTAFTRVPIDMNIYQELMNTRDERWYGKREKKQEKEQKRQENILRAKLFKARQAK